MKTTRKLVKTACIGLSGVSLLISSSFASTNYYEADVISSTPIYRTVETSVPTEECRLVEVARYRPDSRSGYRSRTPDILGAVIGGGIGNAVGTNKSSSRVGAVVGAVLGASVARDISYSKRGRQQVYETVERCNRVYETYLEDKLVGYDVLYSYNNRDYTVRTQRDPGATIQVRVNVEPVL